MPEGQDCLNQEMIKKVIEELREINSAYNNAANSPGTARQPSPSPATADGEDVWLLVMEDMRARRLDGLSKYNHPVHADNGRDHLIDSYQERLDDLVYIRAEIKRRTDVARAEQLRCMRVCLEMRDGEGVWKGKAISKDMKLAAHLLAAAIMGASFDSIYDAFTNGRPSNPV